MQDDRLQYTEFFNLKTGLLADHEDEEMRRGRKRIEIPVIQVVSDYKKLAG